MNIDEDILRSLRETADFYESEAEKAARIGNVRVTAFSAGYANGIRLALKRLAQRDPNRRKRRRSRW